MLLRSNGLIQIVRSHPGALYTKRLLPPLADFATKHYSTTSHESKDVAVLGGGITGLATAYYLSKSTPSARITVYEAAPAIGGWLSSKKVEVDDGHVLFEAGPRTLRLAGNGKLTARLIDELGLLDETIFTSKTSPAARNRYFYYPDELVALPAPGTGAMNIFSKIVGNATLRQFLWRFCLEAFQDPRDESLEDESIGHFLARRIGSEPVDRFVSAVFHGIYAGDVWQLSARSLLTYLWRAELNSSSITLDLARTLAEGAEQDTREIEFQKNLIPLSTELASKVKKSDVFTFRRGLQGLAWKLEDYLRDTAGVEFATNATVASVTKKDGKMRVGFNRAGRSQEPRDAIDLPSEATHSHVVSTLSPLKLGSVVGSRKLTSTLNDIPTVTVMTVNLYYRSPNLHPPGFGYLIPLATPLEQNPERALGVVFDTSYSPDSRSSFETSHWDGPGQDTVSSRGTKLTVMLGGHYWADWPVYPSEDEALQMAKSLLQRHLGITEEPAAFAANLQKDCIPQYTVGHHRRLKDAHQHLLQDYQGDLRIAGNWARGVGVNDCIRSAWDVAREFSEDNKTGLEPAVEPPKYVRIPPNQRK